MGGDAAERNNPERFSLDHRDIELPRNENYTRIEIRPSSGDIFLYREET